MTPAPPPSETSSPGLRRRTFLPRVLAAVTGIMIPSLIFSGGLPEVNLTEANWNDEVHASASFEAGTLGQVNDLDCSGGDILGALLNGEVTLSWEPPYEGFDGIYEVAWADRGLGVADDVFETHETEFEYSIPTSLVSVGAIVAVRPVLGQWKGESTGYFISIVSLLGLPIYTSCLAVIPNLLNIFDPQNPNNLLEPGAQARPLQVAEPTIQASPTTVASSTEDTTSSAVNTSTTPDSDQEETATSSRRVTQTSSPTASTTSTRIDQSPETESKSRTQVPTSTRLSTTESTRNSTSTPAQSTSAPSAEATPTQTTTAPPEITIPSEPNELSSTARTATAGTVDIDGEDHDVVVKGTRTPTDARTASAALDTWINDGTQPTGNWKPFTSTEPGEDGWRWAAINQVTGTIVYIR